MASSGYTPWSVTVGEQPTTVYWNLLGSNDASFNTGAGFNDDIIVWRHLSNDIVPTGLILPYAGASAPSSAWLVCDGSAVSRSTYAALFAVCGTNYGAGDGSTTFNLPSMPGNVPTGVNGSSAYFQNLGQTGGSTDIMAHSHGASTDVQGSHNHSIGSVGTSGSYGLVDSGHASSSGTGYTSSNGGHGHNVYIGATGTNPSNLVPYIVVNFVIKT